MDRIVLVTGAACGLGAEIAHTLAGEHPQLLGLQYQPREADPPELAAELESAGVDTVLLPFDLVEHPMSSSRQLVDTFLDAAASKTGRRQVDVVVNVAGAAVVDGEGADKELTGAMRHLLRLSRLNLAAPMFVVKALLPHLALNSRVVNISTSLNHVDAQYQVACVANRPALDSMITTLASVLAERDATINAVLPGYHHGRMPTLTPEEPFAPLAHPWVSSPIDTSPPLAQIVQFLASQDAHWITGQLIDAPADSGPPCRT